jgi:hypothetical protein
LLYKIILGGRHRTVAARGNPVEVRGEPIAVKPAGIKAGAFRRIGHCLAKGGKAAKRG